MADRHDIFQGRSEYLAHQRCVLEGRVVFVQCTFDFGNLIRSGELLQVLSGVFPEPNGSHPLDIGTSIRTIIVCSCVVKYLVDCS